MEIAELDARNFPKLEMQREIEAVDCAGLKKLKKSSQRCLGFSRTGFRFQNFQAAHLSSDRIFQHRQLRLASRVIRNPAKTRAFLAQRRSRTRSDQSHLVKRFLGAFSGKSKAITIARFAERKESFSDPIQSAKITNPEKACWNSMRSGRSILLGWNA